MKIGLKYTFYPNAAKADKFADLLLGGFGVGGAFTSQFSHTSSIIMLGLGLIVKGLVTFTADADTPEIQ